MGPLSQISSTFFEENFYITKNNSTDSTIIIGSKIERINGKNLHDLYQKYKKCYTSDGYNNTYIPYRFVKNFNTIYSIEFGMPDTLLYTFSYKDSVYQKNIIRKKPEQKKEIKTPKDSTTALVVKKISKGEKKELKKRNKILGFNKQLGTYNYELKTMGKDSSIAYLKIRDFSSGKFRKAYPMIFKEIKEKKLQTLILDLRHNPGGALNNIHELATYVMDKPTEMIDTSYVTKKTSLIVPYFNMAPWYSYPIAVPVFPLFSGYQLIKTKKDQNGKFYYLLSSNRKKEPKEELFNGKMYILVNGGSFSASCLFSALMQQNKRAIIVGEETGGAYNGTVAGIMPVFKIPHSRLKLRLGLMDIRTPKQIGEDGRGVFPDIEIKPSLEKILKNEDEPLELIINQLRK